MTMQMNEFFYGGNEPHWQEVGDYQRRPSEYTADFDYRTSGRTLPTYEFRVPMCCSKCEEKVREELSELEGVYEIFANQLSERVAVTGFVDPFQALKKMKRIKKKSEFWDGSGPTLKSSHERSSHKRSSHNSRKKHHPNHETVYRSSSSQISYNREPSRASTTHGLAHRNKYGAYGDGVSYSGLRPSSSHGLSYRNKYGSYDDGVSYSDLRPSSFNGLSYRNKYGSYDDGVPYSDLRPSSFNGLSYRNKYGSYDDGVSYSDLLPSSFHGLSYKNKYGSYDDGVSYSDLRPSSSLFSNLPRSRSLRYDTVPPFAQDYYTEDYVEDYPSYTHY